MWYKLFIVEKFMQMNDVVITCLHYCDTVINNFCKLFKVFANTYLPVCYVCLAICYVKWGDKLITTIYHNICFLNGEDIHILGIYVGG